MKNLLLCIFFLSALSSCRVTRDRCNQLYPPTVINTTDTVIQIKEVIKDTTIIIPQDSSYIEAYIECDSLNRVVISQLNTQNGTRSTANIRTSKTTTGIKATFDCKCDSSAIYMQWKLMDTTLSTNTHETKIQIVNQCDLTWWQKFKIDYGGYMLAILIAEIIAILGIVAWKIFKLTPYGAAVSGGSSIFSSLFSLFKRKT